MNSKKTNSFVVDDSTTKNIESSNYNIHSDFLHPKNGDNNSDYNSNMDLNSELCKDDFDFDLMAQELANTGQSQSEKELLYIIDTFVYARCFEWVFVLAIVLKNYTLLGEIISQIKSNDLPPLISSSIQRGISELETWSMNECCGYRMIVQKIKNM